MRVATQLSRFVCTFIFLKKTTSQQHLFEKHKQDLNGCQSSLYMPSYTLRAIHVYLLEPCRQQHAPWVPACLSSFCLRAKTAQTSPLTPAAGPTW